MRKKKNSARDVACAKPRFSRQHRKANDNIQIPEKKITDLITSSARKQAVETLAHSTLEHCNDADFTFPVNFNFKEHTVYVRCRPHLMDFMEKVASMFEIIVFTASQSIYAKHLLNMLDPKRKIFRHRVYREACVFVDGNYLKDLTVLGRDLAGIAIIDNSPQAFGFQVDNGIPIESWFDDRSDDALISLVPFLETLVGVDDVWPLIAEKFSLREKVAAAVDPYSVRTKGDPFDM